MTISRQSQTPLGTLRSAWRWLRTMRTALILLLVLAAGAALGSLFPQRPINPARVNQWIAHNRSWAPVAEHLGLFDVFGSWWFMAIYGLLLVSLVGCILPRYRAFWRVLRARPRAGATLETQPQYTSGTVSLSPERALDGAERMLRGRRFRAVRTDDTVAAEKGHLREAGSLVFHTAFLLLLIGVSVGKFFGFTGQVAVVEGDSFVDTRVAYDSITAGRLFGDNFKGFTLAVDDFDVAWWPNGTPRDFVTKMRLFDHGKFVRDTQIAVNKPLSYRGVNVYQLSWGWAPHIVVTQHGKTLYDGPTIFLPTGNTQHGAIKLPSASPQQVGLDMFLLTDPDTDAHGNLVDRSPEPRAPVLLIQPYQGDLNLDVPQSVYELDKTGLVALDKGDGVGLRGTVKLPNGIAVSFPDLKQYTVFQIAANPGAPLLLLSAILILVGLIPALYSSRRRVWVRAAPSDGVARIEIAGHALQRKAAFEEEFKALVRDLDKDLYEMRRIDGPSFEADPREPADVSGVSDA